MTETAASITLVRRIEWIDTDAAGIYHFTTLFRLFEAAEAALHERLGIRDQTFGKTPRVHVAADFLRELRFFDRVEVRLRVAAVGRSSARYAVSLVHAAEGDMAAEGEIVIAHVTGQPGGRATPWPPDVKDRLIHGGDQGRVGEG